MQKNLSTNRAKIFAMSKSLTRKRKKRKRKKTNKKSNFPKKIKTTLTKPVIPHWMKNKKTLSHCKSSRKGPFLIFLIWEKWWDGLKGSLCRSTLSQVSYFKEKRSKKFWWKKKLKFIKKMDKNKKVGKRTEKQSQRRIRTREKTTTIKSWNCSNSLKTWK